MVQCSTSFCFCFSRFSTVPIVYCFSVLIGVLGFFVFTFLRAGVDKGVKKKNAGIPENMGVLGETGSSAFAIGRGILD